MINIWGNLSLIDGCHTTMPPCTVGGAPNVKKTMLNTYCLCINMDLPNDVYFTN